MSACLRSSGRTRSLWGRVTRALQYLRYHPPQGFLRIVVRRVTYLISNHKE